MIITETDLAQLRNEMADKTVAYTCGTFDLLHFGHIEFLEWCSQQADVLVIGLHSDAMVNAKKGPSRPMISESHRLQMINALRMVDYVFIIDSSDPTDLPWIKVAQSLKPNICILGPDWADLEMNLWKKMVPGAEIKVAPPRKGLSTTRIVEDIIAKAHKDERV